MKNKNWIERLLIVNSITLACLIGTLISFIISRNIEYVPSKYTRSGIIEIVEVVTQIVIALGVLLAYIQFKRQRNREEEEGLKLKLTLQEKPEKNLLLLKTVVSNDTMRNIKVKTAFIVLTRHDANFLNILNETYGLCLSSTNELRSIGNMALKPAKNMYMIPLKYFTKENIQVGNETLRYVHPVKVELSTVETKLDQGADQLWGVRFFVFPEKGNHRSVHSVFKGNIKDALNSRQIQQTPCHPEKRIK